MWVLIQYFKLNSLSESVTHLNYGMLITLFESIYLETNIDGIHPSIHILLHLFMIITNYLRSISSTTCIWHNLHELIEHQLILVQQNNRYAHGFVVSIVNYHHVSLIYFIPIIYSLVNTEQQQNSSDDGRFGYFKHI